MSEGLIGRTIGNYRLLAQIGEGGMGTVYKARQLSVDRIVAIKILSERISRDQEFVLRFQREGRIAAQLNHPNVVVLYDVGSSEHFHFIAMEFVEGRAISDIIRERRFLEVRLALDICRQVAAALSAAHALGIVHRDIKPHNVMLNSQGVVKVLDFGVARRVGVEETQITRAGSFIGTLDYMAPEQLDGEAFSPQSDIYSLGATLYTMLAGRSPFADQSPLALFQSSARKNVPPVTTLNPSVPEDVVAVMETALARDLARRYESAERFIAEIDRILNRAGAPVSTMRLEEADPPFERTLRLPGDTGENPTLKTNLKTAPLTRPEESAPSANSAPSAITPDVSSEKSEGEETLPPQDDFEPGPVADFSANVTDHGKRNKILIAIGTALAFIAGLVIFQTNGSDEPPLTGTEIATADDAAVISDTRVIPTTQPPVETPALTPVPTEEPRASAANADSPPIPTETPPPAESPKPTIDPAFERLLREFVANVNEVETHPGKYPRAAAWLRGSTLSGMIDRSGPLPAPDMSLISAQYSQPGFPAEAQADTRSLRNEMDADAVWPELLAESEKDLTYWAEAYRAAMLAQLRDGWLKAESTAQQRPEIESWIRQRVSLMRREHAADLLAPPSFSRADIEYDRKRALFTLQEDAIGEPDGRKLELAWLETAGNDAPVKTFSSEPDARGIPLIVPLANREFHLTARWLDLEGGASPLVQAGPLIIPIQDVVRVEPTVGEITFAKQAPGPESERTHAVKLRNQGASPVEMSDLEIAIHGNDAADFRIDTEFGKHLEPRQTVAINLVFQPASAGEKNATLLIKSKPAGAINLEIALRGESEAREGEARESEATDAGLTEEQARDFAARLTETLRGSLITDFPKISQAYKPLLAAGDEKAIPSDFLKFCRALRPEESTTKTDAYRFAEARYKSAAEPGKFTFEYYFAIPEMKEPACREFVLVLAGSGDAVTIIADKAAETDEAVFVEKEIRQRLTRKDRGAQIIGDYLSLIGGKYAHMVDPGPSEFVKRLYPEQKRLQDGGLHVKDVLLLGKTAESTIAIEVIFEDASPPGFLFEKYKLELSKTDQRIEIEKDRAIR